MNHHRSGTVPRCLAFGAVILLTALTCKKLEQVDVPATNPNPPVGNLPSPPPATSVVPVPNATPTATPPANASPTPSGTATPSAASCNLAPMPEGSPCRAENPSFATQVETAQADVRRTRPDLFNGDRVQNEDAYVQEVARVLRTRGLCAAQGGPKDEVAVKSTNDFNDQYDIVLGSGQPWTSYQVTCRPARF